MENGSNWIQTHLIILYLWLTPASRHRPVWRCSPIQHLMQLSQLLWLQRRSRKVLLQHGEHKNTIKWSHCLLWVLLNFRLKTQFCPKPWKPWFFYFILYLWFQTCHQTIINGKIPGKKTPFISGVITAASLANIACNLLRPSEKIITCFRACSQFYWLDSVSGWAKIICARVEKDSRIDTIKHLRL